MQVLASGQVDTRLPKAEALIRARLDGFPQAAQAAGRHVARALLPPRLARVLQRDPQLVAAAVEAFFYRCVRAAGGWAGGCAGSPGNARLSEQPWCSGSGIAKLKRVMAP